MFLVKNQNNLQYFVHHRFKFPVRCVLPRELDMAITGKRIPYYAKFKVCSVINILVFKVSDEMSNRCMKFHSSDNVWITLILNE